MSLQSADARRRMRVRPWISNTPRNLGHLAYLSALID
jgi:hypothetical protein